MLVDERCNGLTAYDLAEFDRCFITTELAMQARLFRVDSVEGAQLTGRNGRGDYAGLVFPNYLPGEDSPREYRLRRDRPDLWLYPSILIFPKSHPPNSNDLWEKADDFYDFLMCLTPK